MLALVSGNRKTSNVKIVVGLGNPGKKYVATRHNTGFRVIDNLAASLGVTVKRRKFGARVGQAEFAGMRLLLLKPWRFMNLSGFPVAAAVDFFKIALCDLLIVVDDMALETGKVRIRAKGSAGGHNGLINIIEKLKSDEFARLRIGIGQSTNRPPVDFVLDRPMEGEKLLLDKAVERAKEAVLCWAEHGVEIAMNRFNG